MAFKIFDGRNPPTVTAQEKKVAVGKNGKPRYYDPDGLKKARAAICAELERHQPDAPLEGPVELIVTWMWRRRDGRTGWRDTKPDTDNLQKLLKDCMTRTRFWLDDAQVCCEHVSKLWGPPGILITVTEIGGQA
ncbi:MAG: RusA family crossover junction endodeoxyribonuclease [Kiritimatiellae bacterium]|nr:RusA family crossover junction endodeoxyribonuclease [Kiritimatiellia bacterium]